MTESAPTPGTAPQSIAAAIPGWTVTVRSPSSGDPIAVPVAAWVLAPSAAGEFGDHDLVQPAFLLDGGMWTSAEFNEVFGGGVTVSGPAGQP